MNQSITVVMYHYVREIKNSKYPTVRGLEVEGFKRQLDFLQREYSIVSADELLGFVLGEIKTIPINACLLTFDDGYKDHIEFVIPELMQRNLQGSFFPPAGPILKGELLDVNAIHFILACVSDTKSLVDNLFAECLFNGVKQKQLSTLWSALAKPNRFDGPEVMFVKHMLQRELPEELRHKIIKTMFERYVERSVKEFCTELYMSIEDVKELIGNGMYVGSHTYNHQWLNTIEKSSQEKEIDKSLNFLSSIGVPLDRWIMCYPYGAYNSDTLSILRRKNCTIGLKNKGGLGSLAPGKLLEMNRYDTNDFPQ